MNRLTLCQGAQEALCSEVTHAARRGSWQWWGTTSMGYQVLSCPQWHESGATKSHTKGKKHRVCLCITWGIETRKAQSFEAQVGESQSPSGCSQIPRILAACAPGQFPKMLK